MRHRAALFSTILAVTTALVAVGAPAIAAVPGFDVKITELPRTFAAGAGPGTITVVASTTVGGRCQKVRWSMLLKVDGVELGKVKVDRVEEGGSFPLQVQAAGETARLTDAQLDPGQLCTGSTVTARYRVSVDGDASPGRVTFQTEAYDRNERLLQQATVTRRVVSDNAARPTPTEESADPSPSPSVDESGDVDESAADADDAEPGDGDTSETGAISSVPTGGSSAPTLLGPGLIIGAILVFLGVGLLLRLRLKTRQPDNARLQPSFRA